MSATAVCAKCGAGLLSAGLGGLCPKCVAMVALGGPPEIPPLGDSGLTPLGTPNRFFGEYELLEEIARGGMGIVFKARQTGLNRIVAVKMILAGQLASAREVQRFRTEAEAAARLNHPNIVSIYEVGERDGQHYFSMSFVEGGSLAHQIAQFPQDQKAAARLMATIARAVHYAHQRGILHRDLKPGNILMDAQGEPHITDFGLAKLLESQSDLTVSGAVMGTPNYMSPEQAAGRTKDLTTATDIFSLGAIFYHLLSGSPPFAGETAHETLRQVIEEEPDSLRLLQPQLDRDLETICLKCLEKEPGRRYGSAEALADDLERWLNQEPIQARPTKAWERPLKWAKRHPAVASLAAVVSGLIVLVAIGSSVAAVWINHARQQEKAQAVKSRQVADFLKKMLAGVGPSKAQGRDATMLREILNETAASLGSDLKDQPEVEAELRNTIADVYVALGEYPKAEAMRKEALRLQIKVLGSENKEVAATTDDLGNAYYYEGRLEEAEKLHREALAMFQKCCGQEHTNVAMALANLAGVLWQKKPQEAEVAARKSLEMYKKLLGENHEEVAEVADMLANAVISQGRPEEAEGLLRQARAIYIKLGARKELNLATVLSSLGDVLFEEGKLSEAEDVFRQALAIRTELLARENPTNSVVADSMYVLGATLCVEGKLDEAEDCYRESLAIRRTLRDDGAVAEALDGLASALRRKGKFGSAEEVLEEALFLRQKCGDAEGLAETLGFTAAVLRKRGELARAEEVYYLALAAAKKAENEDRFADALSGLGDTLRRLDKLEEAEVCCRDALAFRRKQVRKWELAQALNGLAHVLGDRGKLDEAEDLYREALTKRRKLGDEEDLAETLDGLATVLRDGDGANLTEAEDHYREALTIRRTLGDQEKLTETLTGLARLLRQRGQNQQAQELEQEAQHLASKQQ